MYVAFVAHSRPHQDEEPEDKITDQVAGVDVVVALGQRQEDVGHIHRHEDCVTDHGEIDEVGPEYEPESDDVLYQGISVDIHTKA